MTRHRHGRSQQGCRRFEPFQIRGQRYPSDEGDIVTFTIRVKNDGQDTATNVDRHRHRCPDGFTYQANSIAGGDAATMPDPAGKGLHGRSIA